MVTVREAVTGRVRVSTKTETFAEVVRQELRGMRAEVVRVPVDRTLEPGETPPEPRTEGEVMIIPIFEEVVVVEKRLVLKEELHISQQRHHRDRGSARRTAKAAGDRRTPACRRRNQPKPGANDV